MNGGVENLTTMLPYLTNWSQKKSTRPYYPFFWLGYVAANVITSDEALAI
jgi:hypothetical protein